MVGGRAGCRVEILESGVASEPASRADLVVVQWVLWVVGCWMGRDVGVFGVGPGAGLLVGKVAPEAAILMVVDKVHRMLVLTAGWRVGIGVPVVGS